MVCPHPSFASLRSLMSPSPQLGRRERGYSCSFSFLNPQPLALQRIVFFAPYTNIAWHCGHFSPVGLLQYAFLHSGYWSHAKNIFPLRDFFSIIFPLPHAMQSTPVSFTIGVMCLQSGYPEHPKNAPNLPRFTIKDLPQSGHNLPECSSSIFFSSPSGSVNLQSGYLLHALNLPNLPSLIIRGLEHFGHVSFVASSVMSDFFSSLFFAVIKS